MSKLEEQVKSLKAKEDRQRLSRFAAEMRVSVGQLKEANAEVRASLSSSSRLYVEDVVEPVFVPEDEKRNSD